MVMTWSLECFATGSVMESSGTRELVLRVLLNVLLAGNMSSAFFSYAPCSKNFVLRQEGGSLAENPQKGS